MNFTDQDYYKNIVTYFQDYSELKMLSEINKSSNDFVKRETNFKSIVREKKNKYNCDMLKYYLSKKISYELNNDYKKTINKVRKSFNNFRSLTDKESLYMTYKISACVYTNSMNKGCFPYLEDIIRRYYIIFYYGYLKNKNKWLNTDISKVSIQLSKTVYNIILSIDNNYKLKDENILLWISTNRK